MESIQKAITAFEEYNRINLKNYISDDYPNKENKILFFDNYIGNDIFENHINEWLEFFKEEDREVFLDLLSHYRYFTKEQFREVIKEIYKHIMEEIANSDENDSILLVTFPSKQGTASGGDQIRAMFEEILIGKFKKSHIISDTSKLNADVLDSIKYIVFIDDIVGSGTTLFGNVRGIYDKLPLEKRSDIKYYIAMIYANESKIQEKIKDLKKKCKIDIDILFVHESKDKCFDSEIFFKKAIGESYKAIVKNYETIIEENKLDDDNEHNSILGFNKSQLLISFHYNTPNNTLSTFWRPSKISVPLFIRNSYIRPTIADIRKTENHSKSNAYLKRKLEHVN